MKFWPPFGRKPKIIIDSKQGNRGKWRWIAWNEVGTVVAVSPINIAFDTEAEADAEGQNVFGRSMGSRDPLNMRPIEVTSRWFPLPKRVKAITLWPFVVYRAGHTPSDGLRAHERVHFDQATRWGVLPWYLAYLVLALACWTTGPRHPLEGPAYEIQRKVNRDGP